jgi:phage gp46-like protein
MSDLRNFEGDLALTDSPDGGEIGVIDELFVCDRSFNTAVYLSLFGGNRNDAGKVKSPNEWWGNRLSGTAEAEKMTSRFQAVVAGNPMTTKNIALCEGAALLDLEWLKTEGAADEIIAEGRAGAGNKFYLTIEIKAAEGNIWKNTYGMFWREGLNGGV